MFHFLRHAADWVRGVAPNHDQSNEFHLLLGNLLVGNLRYKDGFWIFEYSDEFRDQSEVQPIMDFPAKDRSYRDKDLWPFFAVRIPSAEQRAVQKFLGERKTSQVDEATMLREFGRHSVANPFELQPC